MKKELLIVSAAIALVGCNRSSDKGGLGTDTSIDRSTPSSSASYTNSTTNLNSSGSLTNTNTILAPQGSAPQSSSPQQPSTQPNPQQGNQGTSPQ